MTQTDTPTTARKAHNMTTTTTDTLTTERRTLTDALASCKRGAFPGSRESRREAVALRALSDFDLAHPEVIGEITGLVTHEEKMRELRARRAMSAPQNR